MGRCNRLGPRHTVFTFCGLLWLSACSSDGDASDATNPCDGISACSTGRASAAGSAGSGGRAGSGGLGATPNPGGAAGATAGGSTGSGGASPTGGSTSNGGAGGSPANGGASGGPDGSSAASDVYHVVGRNLSDPCGEKIVVRGVEQMFWSTSWLSPSFVGEIAKTGANTVRILPQIDAPTPDGKAVLSLADTEGLIQSAIDDKMLVDVAVNGGKDPNVYVRPEVRTMLLAHERDIVIHAKGESYENTDAEWVANSKSVVALLRGAGYKAPLYILATTAGRNLPVILNRGQEILDSDPLKNVVFGWQAYWGSSNYYQNKYGMTLAEALQKVAAASFAIQVGLLHETDPGEYLDHSPVMADAQNLGVGWLWWDWRMSGSNLTTDGTFGHWSSWGQDVATDNPNGIQKTSSKTFYQLNGACR